MPVIQTYYPTSPTYGINLLFSGLEECQPDHSFGPAKRSHFLFHYIIDGKGTYNSGGRAYELTKGQGFMIYPSDVTYYEADADEPWTYFWLGFEGSDCDNILLHMGVTRTNHICTSKDHDSTVLLLSEIIYSKANELANPVHRIAKITSVFSTLAPITPPATVHKTDPVARAIDFIHNNYPYDVRISHLSETVNMERSWLYRIFLEELGQSPKSYLTDYRLNIAKAHLDKEDLTLTEIALSCGFSSSSAFHKQFKKAFGITPKAYRQGHKFDFT